MSIREGTERKVSFNARDELWDKIDKLTAIMGRLAAKDSNDKRQFKPQIHKSRGSYPQGQNRNYDQRNYQNRGRLGNRSGSRIRGQYGNDRHRFQQNYRDNNVLENARGYGRQNIRGEYRDNRCNDYNRCRDRSRERTYSRNSGDNRDRSSSNSR